VVTYFNSLRRSVGSLGPLLPSEFPSEGVPALWEANRWGGSREGRYASPTVTASGLVSGATKSWKGARRGGHQGLLRKV
jgi:hypothetical protein